MASPDKQKRFANALESTPPGDLTRWKNEFAGWGFCYNELRERGIACCNEIERLRFRVEKLKKIGDQKHDR